ncbi:unnamed protein product, partial [Brassica rapa subsp. narinosa]
SYDGDSSNGDDKRSSLSLVTPSLWKEHPVTTNNNQTIRFKISSQKMSSTPHDSPLHDSPIHDSPLHDSPIHDSYLHDSLQLDSNEFCTTLKLPGRVYEAVETPDNPKAIIHHSKIDYIEKRRVLTQGEDLWFTFSDQPMRFSLREFHLTTGLRCEEDQTITEPLFKIMKKPYIWMLGKIDKFTVRTLYEMFKKKARSMPTLERLSLGTAILTEAVIMAENPSSKIPRDRLQRYMNYRSHKIAWVNVLGKSLGKPCETSSSSDPLCLHWDSTRTPTIAEVLELEKINNVEVSTVIGLAEEYKHLVGATHSDDADFHSVVKLVQQGYKMRRSDWEKGFVDMFVATEDIGQQRKTKDEDAEHGEDLNHNEDEEEKKDEEEKTDEEENKDEEYQKDKEQRKDKNHSMSNSEKLDKLIQMVRDLDKRVVMIQNVLGVKFNDSSPNKEDCENGASSGDRRSAQDYENEEDTINEEANSDDKKNAPDDENEEDTIAEAANSEDTIAEEANSGDGRSALDDENEKEICDEEAKSGTEHQREEENILGEIETTQKITQDEDTEKLESESCLKQTSQVTSPTPTFNTPNFDTRVSSPNPTFTSPKFDLLSQESHSGKGTNEVLMRDVYEIPVFQPLMKIKKRLVQQHSQVNEDVEPPLQKKFKADTDNVPLRRSERGQIPSIHTQPPFTGARKKHPILHPFEPVDKTRKEKIREWKMSNKRKKLRINQEIVNAKWFSDIETPGKKLSKTHIEAGFELLKLRQINNPDLFLNKTALVVGVKFLEEIDEFYDEFLDDKKGFQFGAGFDKYNIEKNINFLYSAIAVAEKYWLGVVINLEKRNITAFNCAAMKFTDASLVPYVNAYAMALPFMIRYFFKDVSMDTSKFSIKIVSEGFPQVLKIEDSGVYALKLIECHAMRIVDLTKLNCEVEVSIQEDGFRGSWYRAILEQNPTRVTGKKLRVSYKTMFNEDGVSPLKETIERSFIRPVPPECLNEGVVFKEGSVVDAYFNNGWWTGVIVVERPDGSFLVYFDDPPDIMRFIRSQLRPHADWIGSKWVKSKNKVLSQHMFTRGKLVEMTREISESEKEKIWVRALVITEVRKQGDDRRKFLIKRCTISQNSSDEAEGKHLIVDICKIRPSPPRDLCAEYSLNDYVEVVVTHGWRKGRVTEILLENKYKVYFAATKEDAREFENNAGTPIRPGQDSPSNTLATDEDDTLNDDATKIRSDQESPSITLVLESNEEDKVNDDATEITSSLERHRNTSVLEATEAETQNHETIYGKELPLPHESEDMMDDVATPIIDPQEIPRGETMSESNDKIALPKRISETGTKGVVLQRINKRSNLKLVGKKGLWFTFGEQLMRFSLREFHLTTGLPCVVDKDEDEAETSATKKKKKDPWMNKNQTLNTLLKLLVEKSKELTADQRLRLGATILVEGILMASNPVTSIPEERLLRARNFKEFCKYPWGNLAFDYLLKEVKSFTYAKLTENNQYAICGFIYALQLWALSSVNQLGTFFGISDDGIQFPLCLHWKETKALTIEEVDVKCILGDPGLHSDLVEDVDCEFGRVVDLVKRGYRLKRQDWLNRSVDIAVAEAEVDENNSVPGIDATDQEKIEFLNNKVVSLEERVKYLEGLLNIRGETVKVNGQNADYELDENEVLGVYIDAKRKEIAKVILFLIFYNVVIKFEIAKLVFFLVILEKEEWCKTST